MKKVLSLFFCISLLIAFSSTAFATNGTNLIGIGSTSRSMGGVGIAYPLDPIAAVFANPAAMCFAPYCPGSAFNFDGTLFMPKVDAKVTIGPNTFKADSDDKVYAIPAIGISSPISKDLRFGLAAYGVSGLGVDYRDTSLPMGISTQLMIMKFSPNIAYMVNDRLSVGLGLHINYSSLDLGEGTSFNYGYGVQLGTIFRPTNNIYIGATYISPQNVDHQNVYDFDGPIGAGGKNDLELESPQQIGLGIAFLPIANKLLIEANTRWINWADAKGYEDFDWKDQWVYAVGVQFKPTKSLALRAGYNYGKNPVKEHNGWEGSDPYQVQGNPLPAGQGRFAYEYLRIIGFPAIVEHHVTAGIGYEFSKTFVLNLGFKHVFKKTIKETGTFGGSPVELESTLSENALDLGLTWRF